MRDATKGTMPYGGNEVPAQTALAQSEQGLCYPLTEISDKAAYIGEYRRPCPGFAHYAG